VTSQAGSEPAGTVDQPAGTAVDQPADTAVDETQPEAATGWLRQHAIDTAPLKIAPFRRQVLGQGTSFIGSMLTAVAVPVQVWALSHSSLQVGLVGLVGLLPLVVFGLYGGAVADVVDRRTLLVVSSLGSWACTVGLLAQTLAGLRSVPLILALVAVQSGFFAVASSARGAIIPRIVPTELVPAANTLTFTTGNVGQVIGPLIAGVLVTRSHGFSYAYGVDAVLFTLAMYAALRLPRIPPDGRSTRAGLRSVLDGLLFISSRPVLLMSFAVDIVAMVLAMPRALYPQVAADRWHGQVGPLYAAIAIGSVLAGLSGGWIGRVRRQGVSLTWAVVMWGLAVAAAGLAHQLWLAVLLLAVAGAADLISAVYRQTILQTYAPDQMRGRMLGVFIVVVAGGPRLGDLRAGATASLTGNQTPSNRPPGTSR
jgi:MFS family permease